VILRSQDAKNVKQINQSEYTAPHVTNESKTHKRLCLFSNLAYTCVLTCVWSCIDGSGD